MQHNRNNIHRQICVENRQKGLDSWTDQLVAFDKANNEVNPWIYLLANFERQIPLRCYFNHQHFREKHKKPYRSHGKISSRFSIGKPPANYLEAITKKRLGARYQHRQRSLFATFLSGKAQIVGIAWLPHLPNKVLNWPNRTSLICSAHCK